MLTGTFKRLLAANHSGMYSGLLTVIKLFGTTKVEKQTNIKKEGKG